MKRAIACAAIAVATLGVSTAFAGMSPGGDDDNDYEGRIGKSNQTYFGFDLNGNKSKASGITAYLRYTCDDPMFENTRGLLEIDDSLKVKNGKFDGTVKEKMRAPQMTRGGMLRSITFTYDVKGELENNGKSSGKIAAKATLRRESADNVKCKATNDGKWEAKKGADIDAPLAPVRTG